MKPSHERGTCSVMPSAGDGDDVLALESFNHSRITHVRGLIQPGEWRRRLLRHSRGRSAQQISSVGCRAVYLQRPQP